MTKTTAEKIAKLALENGFVIDKHNDRNDNMPLEVALVLETEDGSFPCYATRKHQYFSINAISKHNGKFYLEPWSVGGVIDMRKCSLEQAVANYNEFHKEATLNNGFNKHHLTIIEREIRKTRYEQIVDQFNKEQDLIHINLI